MVSLDDAVIARLDRYGERFEIFVSPELASKFREAEERPELSEILAVEEVFKDAHKGDRASSEQLMEAFGTADVMKVAVIILEKGEIQLTTEQRKRMQEEKRKQIISLISRNCINPVNKTPHPPQRIELAMEEVKVNIDPFRSAESQMNDIIKELRPILPIRVETAQIAVKTEAAHYGKLVGEIRSFGKVIREEWTKGGEWVCIVEIPAGLQIDFFDMLNSRTHGEVQTRLLNQNDH
ncbi:MAG: ribosome assembly factor SBDS [Candidatus Thermoplasmatota archaeon]|nr:ribosome assembly factor SBDS [Candidatus Thermoplasmatota archaeon]